MCNHLVLLMKMAKLVVAVAHCSPYARVHCDEQPSIRKLLEPPLSLVQWSEKHWEETNALLHTCRDRLLNIDLRQVDDQRAQSDMYNGEVDRLSQYFIVNKALAAFRPSIESQVQDRNISSIEVDSSALSTLRGRIRAYKACEDEGYKYAGEKLESLLHAFSSTNLLSTELQSSPFDLNILQGKVMTLVRKWTTDSFQERPKLIQLGYRHGQESP